MALLPANEGVLSQARVADGFNKKCPYCAEIIKAEAVICRFCGREQPVESIVGPDFLVQLQYQKLHEKKPLPTLTKVLIITAGYFVGSIVTALLTSYLGGTLQDTFGWNFDNAIMRILLGGILGIFFGISIGLAKRSKLKNWALAAVAGFMVSSILIEILLRNVVNYFFVFRSLLDAVALAIAFSVVSKKWQYFLWWFIAGAIGFGLQGFLLQGFLKNTVKTGYFFIVFLGPVVIGVCYGLAFALLENFELKKQQSLKFEE